MYRFFNKLFQISSAISVYAALSLAAVAQQEQNLDTLPNEQPAQSLNQIKFATETGFMLAARYYPGKEDYSGALLLHDCSQDSRSYNFLAELLASYGIHALSLDFRGFGDSISDDFNHQKIKRLSKDINTYQAEVVRLTSHWSQDVLTAYNYLRQRVDRKRDIAVISVGCAAAEAIYLASEMRIKSFVMVTPELDYMEKEAFKNLIDMPVYFIDSVHHADSYQTSKELFEWNGDSRSTFQMFKGIKHGHTLLNGKDYISHDIALWLEDILSKPR